MVHDRSPTELAYFPGCSLVTTAKECHLSVKRFCENIGLKLHELEDWNCCGTSSVHNVDPEAALRLPWRVLSLVPPGSPLLVVCPSCHLRLQLARHKLENDLQAREEYARWFGRSYQGVEILPFLSLVKLLSWQELLSRYHPHLKGLRFAPYYGCMLSAPPVLASEWPPCHEVMEEVGRLLGAEPVAWGYTNQCCGTYLSVVRPDVVGNMVNRIMQEAQRFGAECLVTPCAMCQLNLEIRCTLKDPLPVLHFSEFLALSFGLAKNSWFRYHFVDPRPLLQRYGLLGS